MNWEHLQGASLAEVVSWAEEQPWARAMAACPQDPEWHAEGDVWTHTKLVLEQLEALEEWPALRTEERTVLIFTALFHDVAKPLTTEVDPESGRVRSPKHAVRGEQVARSALRDLGCDLATRERIAALVRYHGRPAFLLERTEPVQELVRLSWLADNRLLYWFALADTRGRDSDSRGRPEENLHYWRLMAEEAGCFDRPYPFATDHARFVYFRQPTPNLHYVPHEDFSCTVTMLSGLPGSGKDTWLSRRRPGSPIVSLDEVREEFDVEPTDDQGRVAQAARERCREHLRSGTSFAFNATNILRATRTRWLELFVDYHARIELVYLEPPFPTLLRQNRARDKAVPEGAVRKLAARCEPPTWLEGHRLELDEGRDRETP